MSDTKTASILQRLPVILAVTAASYGLTLQHRDERVLQGSETQKATAQIQQGSPAKRAKA